MFKDFLAEITVVQVGIILTLLYLFIKLRRDTTYYLLIIGVVIFFLTEFSALTCRVNGLSYNLAYNIGTIFNDILWFYLLLINFNKVKLFGILALAFLCFAFVDLQYIEGYHHFNVYTFVVGALIYLIFFVSESILQFKRENFDFFTTNENLLLYSPLFLFITISALTGFQDSELYDVEIIGGILLYDLVNTFGNLLYYGFINLYIYRVNKLQYA
jgi:hypothetical protein